MTRPDSLQKPRDDFALHAPGDDAAGQAPAGPVALLQTPGLQRVGGIVHAFTTRVGGVSSGACASLNVSTRTGDVRADVFANRQRILQALGRPEATWVGLKQVHGNDVVQVTRQVGPNIPADGMLTTDPQAAIAVLGADCLPMLIADKAGTVVGAAHAGWRGTRAKVGAELVQRMVRHGCAEADLVVALGPAIGPCCYEVDEDVADALAEVCSGESGKLGDPANASAVIPKDDGKFMINLWHINRHTLIAAGVPAVAIDTVQICTHCDARFFSHRRDHGATGRQAGIIALAPGP